MVTNRPSSKKKASKPTRRTPPSARSSLDPTLFEDIIAIGRKIPIKELDQFPRDGAEHFDDSTDHDFEAEGFTILLKS